METIMITKLTGQTVVAASLRAARLRALAELGGTGLGLEATGASVASAVSVVPVVSGLGHTGLCGADIAGGIDGTSVETGLSRGWASVSTSRSPRDERPTQAPKAAVAAMHGGYEQVIGAGNAQKQNEQQINKQAMAAFTGATAIRMRAFRGPEPWRERT
ncbi:hypothetical protein ACWDRR_10330 [Kitasatospora sp. NPDC003701]